MATHEGQIARWNPFTAFLGGDDFAPARLARMSHLMDELSGEGEPLLVPPVDVTETDDAYVLSFEVPGVSKDDIAIECRENTLAIRAEKKSPRDDDRERAYRMERRYGVYTRSVALPDDADLDHISAHYQDGVLRIEIQRKPEAKPRTIPVE